MLKHIAFVCALAFAGVVVADELENGFKTPPNDAKPRTWWHWVSGNASREGITEDLEAMKAIGLGGAQCFSVDQADKKFHGPIRYGSDEWMALTQHAIKECNRLGLELTLHACEGWSESGGKWITPELSMQKVVWSETSVKGPKKVATTLPAPEVKLGFYRDIAIFAFPQATTRPVRVPDFAKKSGMAHGMLPDSPPTTQVSADSLIKPERLIDLTSKFDDKGVLNWDAPAGEWTILRMGHTSTGKDNAPAMEETRGLECDKLSREAVKAFYDGMLAKIIAQAGPLAGHGLDFVLMDSWEAAHLNWTPKFREEFQKRRGYDPLPWMPAVAGRYVDSPEKTERFLFDYRRTIADLIADNHHGYTREMLAKHGMKLTSEAVGIGMPVCADQLLTKGRTDVPMGEFWVGQVINNNGDAKEAASAAHIYGKKYVAAESFTAAPEHAGWRNDPASLKQQGDLMFTVGINRYVFHRYAHQPDDRKPGITMGPWGINFERSNTWWEPGRAWIDYVSRCQFMLQQGLFVADILYYYGEGAPRELQPAALNPPLPAGYDYDVCNAEVLLTRANVKDGRIVLPKGMSYRVLVLPQTDRMSPAVLAKVRDLVEDGATVVGPKPVAAPGLSDFPSCDQRVKVIANRLWGDCNGTSVVQNKFGEGRICWGKPMVQVLAGSPPDFEAAASDEGAEIRSIHRRTDHADIYFVSNQEPRYETVECTFRVAGKQPEIWHADSGEMEPATLYRERDGRTTVTLQLEPSGSAFVVFRKPPAQPPGIVSLTRGGQRISRDLPAPASLKVTKAVYGVLDDAAKQKDVTSQVAAMVKGNRLRVHAGNEIAGDPARDIRKQFRLEYVLDGKPQTRVGGEGENIEIPDITNTFTPLPAELNGEQLTVWENGAYDIAFTSAELKRVYVEDVPAAVEIGGPWRVQFPPKWGAPESVTFAKLQSWTESGDAGIKYFSGTARYVKEFELSDAIVAKNRCVQLDLGQVKNLASVTLNGRSLGTLWKPPFVVDVTSAAKRGTNRLEVKVTNLWPNRLIGDKQLPQETRFTWTTYDPYKADSPLLPSGLLGPVKVRMAKVVQINAR